ncbi:hypothetical protein [Sphingomonas soli]|uniref:hypothetical protein n=1 Tax=Sphingomonas soli TaxID=266127 RepID=UPI000830ECA7|nr:hypothetical protein [Sphingomonas soli]
MLGWLIVAASAFNLLCTGTTYLHNPADPYSAPETYQTSETYRIDLKKGRWCLDRCTSTIAIAKIEPTVITLQDIATPIFDVQAYSVTIDRETGLLLAKLVVRGIESRSVLQCELRPFTGFPAIRF